MTVLNGALADELLAMAGRDAAVRQRLLESGQLFDGYHPEMEAVHNENGRRLAEIIERYGFPGRSLVGEDGAQAAWLIVQHAIGLPSLQRAALPLIGVLAARGEIPPVNAAMLEDRIRCFEGKRQRFGTQFDWDEADELSPLPIEDIERVDTLRAEVGLPPLERSIALHRARARASNERPPKDGAKKERERQVWLKRVGWRVT